MRKAILTIALLAFAAPIFAQVDHKVEKELQASYGKVIAAIKKKDVKTVMSLMTPDATMKEMGQTMKRDQFEAMFTQQIKVLELESSTLTFSKVAAKGNVATTEYVENTHAKMPGPDGKPAKYVIKTNYKTIFKKIGGDWKMHKSESVGMPIMTVNGKPFNPQAPKK